MLLREWKKVLRVITRNYVKQNYERKPNKAENPNFIPKVLYRFEQLIKNRKVLQKAVVFGKTFKNKY